MGLCRGGIASARKGKIGRCSRWCKLLVVSKLSGFSSLVFELASNLNFKRQVEVTRDQNLI